MKLDEIYNFFKAPSLQQKYKVRKTGGNGFPQVVVKNRQTNRVFAFSQFKERGMIFFAQYYFSKVVGSKANQRLGSCLWQEIMCQNDTPTIEIIKGFLAYEQNIENFKNWKLPVFLEDTDLTDSHNV